MAMASTMGRPQPSPRVGSTKQSMDRYTDGRSAWTRAGGAAGKTHTAPLKASHRTQWQGRGSGNTHVLDLGDDTNAGQDLVDGDAGVDSAVVGQQVPLHGAVEVVAGVRIPHPRDKVQQHLPPATTVKRQSRKHEGTRRARAWHRLSRARTLSLVENARAKADTRTSQPFRNSHLNTDTNLNADTASSDTSASQRRADMTSSRVDTANERTHRLVGAHHN